MATTNWVDASFGLKSIPNRTDNTGTELAADLSGREEPLLANFVTEGVVKPAGAFVPAKGSGDFDVDLGSGTPDADVFVVESDADGQSPYLVQLKQTTVTVTLDAADADARIDELYLVVRDDGIDSNADGHRLARIGYRKGDASSDPVAPGPDAGWENYALLASITVGAGANSITSDDITDERTTSQLLQRPWDEAAKNTSEVSQNPHGSGDHDGSVADDPHDNSSHSTPFSATGHGSGDHNVSVERMLPSDDHFYNAGAEFAPLIDHEGGGFVSFYSDRFEAGATGGASDQPRVVIAPVDFDLIDTLEVRWEGTETDNDTVRFGAYQGEMRGAADNIHGRSPDVETTRSGQFATTNDTLDVSGLSGRGSIFVGADPAFDDTQVRVYRITRTA